MHLSESNLTLTTGASDQPTTVVLVGMDFGRFHFDGDLQELGLLAQTAGLASVARITCKRQAPDPALFVGKGKADEIRMLVQQHGKLTFASCIFFTTCLSPSHIAIDAPW